MHTVSFPNLGLEFNLNPVIFSIGNFQMTWYGALIGLGILLAMWMAFRNCKRFGIISDKMVDVVLAGIIGGIIGARLYFVAFRWEDYKDDLTLIFKTWEGGMAIYGGIIGAFLAGALVARLRKVKVLPMMDLAGMGFLIGQGIGRWGNFVNGEAFGSNTNLPWGMTGDRIVSYLSNSTHVTGQAIDAYGLVHPCFLYESIWCLLGFGLLYWYSKRRRFDGEVFLLYLAWYGLGRTFIEGLRTDSLMIGNIRVSQLLAALLVVASVILLLAVRSRIKAAHDDNYLKCYGETEAFQQELADYEAELAQKEAARKAGKAGKGKKGTATESEQTDAESVSEPVFEAAPEVEEDASVTDEPAAIDAADSSAQDTSVSEDEDKNT